MSKGNEARRQYLAARLAANTASDAERDEALGTILLSLFSQEDVEKMIDRRHNELCAACPAKSEAKDAPGMKDWLIKELIRLLGLAIVIVGSLTGIKEFFMKGS